MTRGKPPPHPARKPVPPPAPKGHALRWVAGAVLVVGLLALSLWLSRGRSALLKPPVLDLSKASPEAAATIRKHLQAVTLHPQSGAAWGQLGMMLRIYTFPAQALECLAEAERLEPANPRWPYFQGLLLKVPAPEQALLKLRQTVRLCGNEPEAPRYLLASMLAEMGRWEEARVELQAMLQVKPDFIPAHLLLARRAQALGKLPEAIALARRCTEDWRTARGAWTLLANLDTRQGDAAAAAEATRKAAFVPADGQVADPYEAEAALLRGDPLQIGYQTHAQLAAGKLTEAAPAIERLVREHPNYPQTWLLLGRYQLLRNEFTLAEPSLRHYLQLDPQSSQGLFQLGSVLLSQNRFLEAADVFDQATRLKPDYGPAYFNRAYALARGGRPREALAPFREAIRHNPEHVESYLLLADLLLQLGDKAEAAKLLATAAALKPEDPRLDRLRQRMGR
jgi:tetratricopeptide (TPR) repeat protein